MAPEQNLARPLDNRLRLSAGRPPPETSSGFALKPPGSSHGQLVSRDPQAARGSHQGGETSSTSSSRPHPQAHHHPEPPLAPCTGPWGTADPAVCWPSCLWMQNGTQNSTFFPLLFADTIRFQNLHGKKIQPSCLSQLICVRSSHLLLSLLDRLEVTPISFFKTKALNAKKQFTLNNCYHIWVLLLKEESLSNTDRKHNYF